MTMTRQQIQDELIKLSNGGKFFSGGSSLLDATAERIAMLKRQLAQLRRK